DYPDAMETAAAGSLAQPVLPKAFGLKLVGKAFLRSWQLVRSLTPCGPRSKKDRAVDIAPGIALARIRNPVGDGVFGIQIGGGRRKNRRWRTEALALPREAPLNQPGQDAWPLGP